MPAVGSVCNACAVGSLHSRCSTPVPPTCSPGGRVHLNSRRPCGLAEQQLAIGEAQMSAEPAVVQLEALMAKTDARKRLGDGLTAWQNSANLFQCATYAQNSMPECHCQLWMAPRRFPCNFRSIDTSEMAPGLFRPWICCQDLRSCWNRHPNIEIMPNPQRNPVAQLFRLLLQGCHDDSCTVTHRSQSFMWQMGSGHCII